MAACNLLPFLGVGRPAKIPCGSGTDTVKSVWGYGGVPSTAVGCLKHCMQLAASWDWGGEGPKRPPKARSQTFHQLQIGFVFRFYTMDIHFFFFLSTMG